MAGRARRCSNDSNTAARAPADDQADELARDLADGIGRPCWH
jgi:hypothetical protein